MTPASAHQAQAAHFENLDGLRFVCFLGVFLLHGFHNLGINVTGAVFVTARMILTLNGNSGKAGVGFFFVLSGFLITYLMLQELRKTGAFSLPQFYLRRALRIWPLYYAVVLFAFYVSPVLARLAQKHYEFERAGLVEFLLFWANFDVFRHGFPVNGILGVQWSLAIEEQFYVVWPLIFLVFSRTPGRLRHYPWVFVTLIGWSFLFRAVHAGEREVLLYHTFSVMGDLATGGLAGYLVFTKHPLVGWVRDVPRRAIVAVYLAGVAVIMFQDDIFVLGSRLLPFARLLTSAFFAFVILEQNDSLNSWFKMSRFPRVSRLGKYTYGLYSLHMVGILLAAMVFSTAPTLSLFLQRMALATVVTFVISVLSYHAFESYFLRLKERCSPLRTSQGSAAGLVAARNAAMAVADFSDAPAIAKRQGR